MAKIETNEEPVVIKWFGWRNPLHFYLSPLFPGRAWRSWELAHVLKERAVRTPKPLYVYARRQKGFIHENFFITTGIYPHKTLRVHLMSDASPPLIEQAVTDLALSIARMHNGGILHRDLTPHNFLVGETGQVFIVDLNRARIRSRLSDRQRLSDLARLSFAARNRALEAHLTRRFFQVYGTETHSAPDWEARYTKYRRRWRARRRWKKRLQGLVLGK